MEIYRYIHIYIYAYLYLVGLDPSAGTYTGNALEVQTITATALGAGGTVFENGTFSPFLN